METVLYYTYICFVEKTPPCPIVITSRHTYFVPYLVSFIDKGAYFTGKN